MEGLHRLAEQRAKERAKESRKRQLESKSSHIEGVSTNKEVQVKSPGSKKRKKNDLEVDQERKAGSKSSSKVKASAKLSDEPTNQHDVPVNSSKSSKRSSGKKKEHAVCDDSLDCNIPSNKRKGKSKMEGEDLVSNKSAGEPVSAKKLKMSARAEGSDQENLVHAQSTCLSSDVKLKRKGDHDDMQQHSNRKGSSLKKSKNCGVDHWQFSGDSSEGECEDHLSCNGRLDFDGLSTGESGVEGGGGGRGGGGGEEEVEVEGEGEGGGGGGGREGGGGGGREGGCRGNSSQKEETRKTESRN